MEYVIQLCVWKNVANNDRKKVDSGNSCTTFNLNNPNLECLSCDGYNASCETYVLAKLTKKNSGEKSNSKLEKVTA